MKENKWRRLSLPVLFPYWTISCYQPSLKYYMMHVSALKNGLNYSVAYLLIIMI